MAIVWHRQLTGRQHVRVMREMAKSLPPGTTLEMTRAEYNAALHAKGYEMYPEKVPAP